MPQNTVLENSGETEARTGTAPNFDFDALILAPPLLHNINQKPIVYCQSNDKTLPDTIPIFVAYEWLPKGHCFTVVTFPLYWGNKDNYNLRESVQNTETS